MIEKGFKWRNAPRNEWIGDRLHVTTSPATDFWQRTHYGFMRDNGHALMKRVDFDFSLAVRTESHPKNKYDQCGLMIRHDPDNWIKVSSEYENEEISRLGSVVTSQGYSDWATTDIPSADNTIWFRIQSLGQDFLIESSLDGLEWKQMRVTHMLAPFACIEVGIYACSPSDGSFLAVFDHFRLEKSNWR